MTITPGIMIAIMTLCIPTMFLTKAGKSIGGVFVRNTGKDMKGAGNLPVRDFAGAAVSAEEREMEVEAVKVEENEAEVKVATEVENID